MVWRLVILAAASGSILAPVAHAAGVVQWNIQRRQPSEVVLHKRAGTQQQSLVNNLARGGYFATCAVGTPPQEVTLQLDTGSSDVWVPAHTASVCSENACTLGSFNTDESSTFDNFAPGEFEIAYVDRSFSKGDYFRDAFSIAGVTVDNMTMGLGTDTTIAYGLLGLGYALNEAIIPKEEAVSAEYPNLPTMMVREGLIATDAYSLWLNDLDASTGSILFGGIDTLKYEGNLTRIPIIQNPVTNAHDSFIVGLTSVFAVSVSGIDRLASRQAPINVVLDSGTTLSYLPTDLAQQIWAVTGATYSQTLGLALIPCVMRRSTGYFSFTFAGDEGPTIRVGMDELVLGLVVSGPAPTFTSGQNAGQEACEFGIQNTTGTNLLGDTFLRSAYVVYDLSNNEIGLAQTDFNATESNIVPFESQGAVIPSSTRVSNASLAAGAPAFTEPAFIAQPGFSNGTESSASARDPVPLNAMSLVVAAMAFTAGAFIL